MKKDKSRDRLGVSNKIGGVLFTMTQDVSSGLASCSDILELFRFSILVSFAADVCFEEVVFCVVLFVDFLLLFTELSGDSPLSLLLESAFFWVSERGSLVRFLPLVAISSSVN